MVPEHVLFCDRPVRLRLFAWNRRVLRSRVSWAVGFLMGEIARLSVALKIPEGIGDPAFGLERNRWRRTRRSVGAGILAEEIIETTGLLHDDDNVLNFPGACPLACGVCSGRRGLLLHSDRSSPRLRHIAARQCRTRTKAKCEAIETRNHR